MDIKILGPFAASMHEVSVLPSAAKPRQVLALLALHADRMVTVPTLMEELWGEAIPRSAATTLQTYILQLRRRIGEATCGRQAGREPKDVLLTRHGGYLLQVQPGQLDIQDFEQYAEDGRAACDAGRDEKGSELLRKALDTWRGQALVDVPVGGVLELEVLRLEEGRMATLERRIGADMRLGRHAELIPELTVLAAKYPMHENFCAQLMAALHGSGSSWRALEAYQRLRGTLVDELGLEPSRRLRNLHQAVLAGDQDLVTSSRGSALEAARAG
ncbi:AfsR/SARP family transcriptional regulator [Streptomyces sp. ACA25]|uniref:AfsR/SARP family transcriptional regulator n=1 Tax=Streptomyces sp. ACA25 TaxID=3022596 RepID=UPI0023081D69|nr:AfsR/SARP family transcriptional regulator [Streptomyces sp. ACA25]MDB1089576.1 AfsR/SARP family transcriptional regulator [Streptomyces sp. ACA25]